MLSNSEVLDVAGRIWSGSRAESRRLDRVNQYVTGEYPSQAYVPEKARAEYLAILARSRVPVLSLVVDSLAQRLFVDGYRPSRQATNSPLWEHWQANRMDARQSGVHRSAATFGAGYCVVLPGDPVPVWRPVSARRMTAVYEDRSADQWPVFALESWTQGSPSGPVPMLRLYDEVGRYDIAQASVWQVTRIDEHGLGVCPVVRFCGPDDLDRGPVGAVEPLIPMQDQIDASTYYTEMAQQYAVHRQRWVTGLAIPTDDDGNEIEPYRAAISRLWQSENPDTRFGEFAQTDIKAWLDAREASLRHMAIKSQTPPASLLGNLVEMSAEALAAAEIGHTRLVGEYQASLGESWEQAFRLSAMCAGDEVGAADESAQVVWRDTEARSLAAVADALGKLQQNLGIPARGLWEKIPGVTDQDLAAWESLAAEGDAMSNLNRILDEQLRGAPAPSPVA